MKDDLFGSGISIEQFAAYLDGNLPESAMEDMASEMAGHEGFQQLLQAEKVVDEVIECYSPTDYELPVELQTLDFEIPYVDDLLQDMQGPVVSVVDDEPVEAMLAARLLEDSVPDTPSSYTAQLATPEVEEPVGSEDSIQTIDDLPIDDMGSHPYHDTLTDCVTEPSCDDSFIDTPLDIV